MCAVSKGLCSLYQSTFDQLEWVPLTSSGRSPRHYRDDRSFIIVKIVSSLCCTTPLHYNEEYFCIIVQDGLSLCRQAVLPCGKSFFRAGVHRPTVRGCSTPLCWGTAPSARGETFPLLEGRHSLCSKGAVHLARVGTTYSSEWVPFTRPSGYPSPVRMGTPDPPDTKGSYRAARNARAQR